MKIIVRYILLFIISLFISCNQSESSFYNQILKSESGQLRGIEISASIENVREKENEKFLRNNLDAHLHYNYEINMGNSYNVTYDFSKEKKLYEIEVAVFLDDIKDATLLFDNFSNHFIQKYGVGHNESDGYITWNTNSSISNNRVAISIINDSESYGFITIIIRDLDY